MCYCEVSYWGNVHDRWRFASEQTIAMHKRRITCLYFIYSCPLVSLFVSNWFNAIDAQQVSEEVERALAKLGPARLSGRSKIFSIILLAVTCPVHPGGRTVGLLLYLMILDLI